MAELLTNDPAAMESLGGYDTDSPCGLLWLSPCTFNNFNDWYQTLKARYKILYRNYVKLQEIEKIPGKAQLTQDEKNIVGDMNDIKEVIDEMKDVKQDLHRDTYFQKISKIQSALADTNALIETVQESIEDRGGKYVTTGIQRPPGFWTFTNVLILAVVATGGYFAVKSLRGKSTPALPTP